MWRYIVRRLVLIIPTLILVTVLVFTIPRLLPGSVVEILAADTDITKEQIKAEEARLGLDRPIYAQYFVWMGSLLRGDLGRSLWSNRPVVRDITARAPVSFELAILALIFSVVIGIPIGIVAAIRQDSILDYILRSLAIGGLAIPNFWLATILLLIFSLQFNWLPPLKYESFLENPWENIQQMIFPSFLLGLVLAATLMRMTRATLLEVLRQDYVRTAWAKGLAERIILLRHALKNAFIPVVTILGLQVATLVGGSVIVENIFGIPGLGQYVLQVVRVKDYPSLQAINLLLATFIMFVNLAVDVSLAFFDPRIRYN